MLDLDKISKSIMDSITTESVRDFFNKKRITEQLYVSQVERFYQKHKDNMPTIIEKIVAKYDTDKYVYKEYKLGYEPRRKLLWVILSIASKYGIEVEINTQNEEKYPINMFTSCAYIFEGYFIQRMDGQGAAVIIDKI